MNDTPTWLARHDESTRLVYLDPVRHGVVALQVDLQTPPRRSNCTYCCTYWQHLKGDRKNQARAGV